MSNQFFLYVEGPRDLELLTLWARQESPQLAKEVEKAGVILGGRQPDRASTHLGQRRHASGVCLLDRDEGLEVMPSETGGLRFHQWTRRHIESYLLVRRVLRAGLAPREDPHRLDRLIEEEVPESEAELRTIHAKRLLGAKGPFAKALGRTPDLRRVARCMRSDDLHTDIQALFSMVREGIGLQAPAVSYKQSV